MLKIQNIKNIVGMIANNRTIIAAGDYDDRLEPNKYFVFKIAEQYDAEKYNKHHDIVLTKEVDETGDYYMFNMGLERVTGIHVPKYHMRNPADFAVFISKVLRKTESYYQTS